jgi:hypothetical protein
MSSVPTGGVPTPVHGPIVSQPRKPVAESGLYALQYAATEGKHLYATPFKETSSPDSYVAVLLYTSGHAPPPSGGRPPEGDEVGATSLAE